MPASCGPDTASPATAPSAARTGAQDASATTSPTRSSTTAPDSPTSSSTTDEKAATVTGFVERALAFFARHGISAKRLMTDNAFSYINNRSLRELLAHNGIRHLTTKPYRPRTNGKVERFHQTMAREWAYGLSYRSPRHRAKPCHTGSTTTTTDDHTARSETDPRSAAFTTSV